MTEKKAYEIAKEIFKKHNIIRWHDIAISFGPNTNIGYNSVEKNDPSILYNPSDLVYVDVGIVIDKTFEGDYGETFYRGSDERYKKLI